MSPPQKLGQPRERGKPRDPESSRDQNPSHRQTNDGNGRHQNGAENEKQRRREGKANERSGEREAGEEEEGPTDGNESYNRNDLRRGRSALCMLALNFRGGVEVRVVLNATAAEQLLLVELLLLEAL